MPKVAQLQLDERGPQPRAAEVQPIGRPETRYFAFLSYSHKDEDVADWLHSQLENFRVPAMLAGRLTSNGVIPKRLTPIFRDRHELAAADDLGAEIRSALASSQFLIVLCSPAAAASRWTNAEIEAFKRVRPDGCVLAAIVAGEPFASDLAGREAEECFPPALRYKYDRRGRPTTKRAEPLAADLRASGDGRRAGFLKLVAGMLGVGLDELVQRENVRRQRRLAWAAAASLAGMGVTSSLAVWAIQARDEARDQRREAEGLVGFMLGDLRAKLEPIGRLDTLDAVGTRALAYFQKQDKSELSDEALAQRARALTLMGEIANARGNLDAALRLYSEAFASTAEALRRDSANPQRMFDHAQNVYWVGYIDWQRGRLDRAEAAFRNYRRLAEGMIASEPNELKWRLEQNYADTNLGVVLLEQRRFADATATFSAALEASEILLAAEPKDRANQDRLLEALAWLADARERSGDLEGALAQRERQLRLMEQLTSERGADAGLKRKVMPAERAIGRLLASRGEARAGLAHAQRAADLAAELLRTEPGNSEWAQVGAESTLELGDLQLALGQHDAAAVSARAGCDLAGRLAGRDASVVQWRAGLGTKCLALRAKLALARGAIEEARARASELLRLVHAEAARQPTVDGSIALAEAQMLLAQIADRSGDRMGAVNAWRAAAAGWPEKVELTPRERSRQAVLLKRIGYAESAERLSRWLDARGYRHPTYVNDMQHTKPA